MGFTRKEAEHLLTLPESMLEKLGLITDKSIIEHYVKGGDISTCSEKHKRINAWNIVSYPSFSDNTNYYIAEPPEIEIFGVKVRCNPPMSEAPKDNTLIYVLLADNTLGYSKFTWDGTGYSYMCLKRGLCFEREEDAKKAVQALFEDLQ